MRLLRWHEETEACSTLLRLLCWISQSTCVQLAVITKEPPLLRPACSLGKLKNVLHSLTLDGINCCRVQCTFDDDLQVNSCQVLPHAVHKARGLSSSACMLMH